MHKVNFQVALLAFGVLCSGHVASAQQAHADPAPDIVGEVMEYRLYWMGDSTQFNACRVYEHIGRPANFPAVLSVAARRLLDRPADPCGKGELPPRRVAIHSVTVGDSVARVSVFVLKGEKRHREDFRLRGGRSGPWEVEEVTLSRHMYFSPPPPAARPPQ